MADLATLHLVILLFGGIIAGIVGTAGGVTSLVAYPLLLAVGIPPLTANFTGSVAMLGSGLGSTLRAGPWLAGHRVTLRRWIPVAIAGSAAGAVLLLVTPPDLFSRIVPFLVATGAVVLLVQPHISRWNDRRHRRISTAATSAAMAGITIYNGYFGAGSGVLMIGLLLLTLEPRLLRANALKNVLLVAADILPAVLFVIFGHVIWPAVVSLGLGTLIGGLIGPSVARRIPTRALRLLIALSGFALAVWLFLRP